MEFRLLGAFEVWDGEQPVEIAGSKQRALLALLVLRANEVVRTELLVDELWGERPPHNAAAALHTHVSRLRKALGAETIARREWGYVLRAAAAEIDSQRFETLVAEAEPLAARERAIKLAEALALWRGPPLADLVNEPALHSDIARLEELRLRTLERRIDADLEGGNADVVGELETLVAQQPLREHLRWLLILALYRAGRQAEALEVYRETRRVLIDELGLEPSPALKELEQAILRQDPSLEASTPSTHAELPAEEPQSRRRRVPPFALLALLALGLAGAAIAIALVRPEKGTSSGTATEAIFETLPITVTYPTKNADRATTTPPATDKQTTGDNHTTTPAAHSTSSGAITSTKPPSLTHATSTVAPKTKTNPKPAAAPKPVTIADNFSDPTLDGSIWTTWGQGTGSSYAQSNGQGVFSIATGATFEPQFHSVGTAIGTKCKFPGNFDARVGFTLVQWPAANGAAISLTAYQTGPVELVKRFTSTVGDGYNAWPNGASVQPLADPSGSLRMTRSNGIIRVFYMHHGQWTKLGRIAISGEIWVGVGIGTDQSDWQQQAVSAAFDNFVLRAPRADCPAGSNP
jgi:DNA-binding SARP family transcriptional activator